jgi:hypothetical protein
MLLTINLKIMKFKLLLLFVFLSAGLIKAQPYRNLIFSEVRMDAHHHSYVELTNMGASEIELSEFEVGSISPWTDPFFPGETTHVKLPSGKLQSGESYVIATVRDWVLKMSEIDPERYAPLTKDDIWRKADLYLHVSEAPSHSPYAYLDEVDDYRDALVTWGGGYCFYLRHHFTNQETGLPDSLVIDAVNGIFTGTNGQRPHTNPSSVAGFTDATAQAILYRKFSVKSGNNLGDSDSTAWDAWERTRGVDITDSEWLPVPFLTGGFEPGRKAFWTVGNHSNVVLDENTIVSNTIDIDWDNNEMTVQWGARNMDSIMNEFQYQDGIAWGYDFVENSEDSAFTSVRTGDVLTLYALGNTLDTREFTLNVTPPSDSEARVVPKNARGGGGWYTPYIVTENVPGMDSIMEVGHGTRVDSLFKYLEKPDQASWEIVWADGVERPDLRYGDILKVTAANGTSTKEYFINELEYRPSDNANLASITWPDIPEYYKGIFGWVGDTIPEFSPTKFNYNLEVPFDYDGIPALVAKPENPDATIEIIRASSLAGSFEDRTIKFIVTAENDTIQNVYSITLSKQKDMSNLQPFEPEPIISEFVFRADWRQMFIEIYNPGTVPLDLSKYCIVRAYESNPVEAIATFSGEDDFGARYRRYVPGYMWDDETNWAVQPSMLVRDGNIDAIVEPGDVFVIAWAFPDYKDTNDDYPRFDQINVNFKNGYNPWGIEFTEEELASYDHIAGGWYNDTWYLYKITNDTVLNGEKPLTNPADAQIIDVLGRTDGTAFGTIDGQNYDQNSVLTRKPNIYTGNILPGGSFGDGETGSEWIFRNEPYWAAQGYGWPATNSMNSDGIGAHEVAPITEFISTIASVLYIVSDGFTLEETIVGPEPGITVDDFLLNIIKSDEDQELTVSRDGTEISGADELQDGDKLTVVSANGDNTTIYTITVAEGLLDDNATLTSDIYDITIDGSTGVISGIDAGTKLIDVYDGVTAPASIQVFSIFYESGEYAPFKMLNYDSIYVDVIATENIFFEVVAQNGVNKITYQLDITSSSSDAYVLSSVYEIDQDESVISLLPDGINVSSFFKNLIPAPGATIELQNNMGQVRDFGTIVTDDVLIVTAEDGTTQKIYTITMLSEVINWRTAYIFSDVYSVTQNTRRITVDQIVDVSTFLDNIYTIYDATFQLLDENGSVKTSGDIAVGDYVSVTSFDGSYTQTYTILFPSSVNQIDKVSNIKMYPNPTNGTVNISGIEKGNNIRIFNYRGQSVANIIADSSSAIITLENQASGIYLITVDNGHEVISRSRIVKR